MTKCSDLCASSKGCSRPDLVVQESGPGVRVLSFARGRVCEHFVTVCAEALEDLPHAVAKASAAVSTLGAAVVAQDVFGVGYPDQAGQILRDAHWPVTCLPGRAADGPCGTQVWALSGAAVKPVEVDGQVTGAVFEDASARYCRLGGLTPTNIDLPPAEQAKAVFSAMERSLEQAGMSFSNVVRTWFYNRDILSWYREFNQVRDAFFRARGVFGRLVPASTGMGGGTGSGPALTAGLLAVVPKSDAFCAQAVPSPLQCPALDYGSSFSRAVELSCPDHRRLFISGTASIGEDGITRHLGDTIRQIELTMDVIRAILESRAMTLDNTTRLVAYFKDAEDIPLFGDYCLAAGLPPLPVVYMNDDVCRGDLLFEAELDAISSQPLP